MKLYVKYIVNEHAKTAVRNELKGLGMHFVIDGRGNVDVMENITSRQHKQIGVALSRSGLELLSKKKAVIIEKIERNILEMVHSMDDLAPADYPDYLTKSLKYDYVCLALLFSEGTGTTIENFINEQRIERVKELIIYDGCSNREISRKMHYGKVADLSGNFRKTSGMTISHFRKLENERGRLSSSAGIG